MARGGIRIRKIWDGSYWDDGYLDNKGRFRVYRPDYPRAYSEGYAMRYHVVWWLATGEVHPKGTNLHHINEIKDDDRFENLELMKHGEHTRYHSYLPEAHLTKKCRTCEQEYTLPRYRILGRAKEGTTPQYCSQACYHAAPKRDETRDLISSGLELAYLEGRR